MRFAAVIITAVSLSFAAASTSSARICPRDRHGHCARPSVSYTYVQQGHDQFGNAYWRLCHVPLHHRRWCGPWQPLGLTANPISVGYCDTGPVGRVWPCYCVEWFKYPLICKRWVWGRLVEMVPR